MISYLYKCLPLAVCVLAQGDLAGLLQSQPDLSTLLDLVELVPGLASTLGSSSNITILAPTNQAFLDIPPDIPEGIAVRNRNVTAISALLANHVFKGYYPASSVTEVPTFAQILLNSSYLSDVQPFSNITGGQYNGLVKNGQDVNVISGELSVSNVTAADIPLGEGIIIHKIDKTLSFGPPLQLFTARDDLFAMNSAIEASGLGLSLGNQEGTSQSQNVSDITVFIPTDAAFENIGSVLNSANQTVLDQVLSYHILPGNVVFSPSLSNTTAPSLQGNDLQFSLFPDGSAFVNNARIIFPNIILFNGVAHIIDSVLNPTSPPPDRGTLDPNAQAEDRVQYPGATSDASLPFSTVSYADETSSYSTPAILATAPAVAIASSSGSGSATPTGESASTFTGAATRPTRRGLPPGIAVIAAWMFINN